ncbi:MAG: TatD family hydrolase [Gallionella sp.]|nr:TatD family hydrolase [Gallionella sp.]
MNLIDTHCHLDAAEFGEHQAQLLTAARAAGVNHIVVPSVTRANFDAVRRLCEQHPGCFPAYGIHPMFVDDATPQDLEILRDYLRAHQPVAIGEIGLDFFIEHYDQARQEYFFTEQLKLAREFNLPVLLHTRRSQDVILKHLRKFYGSGGTSTRLSTGIAHAFSGSKTQADEFIRLGFKLGFGGAASYPRATRIRELAKTLPLDSIVLETDAPDMRPEFIERGQPNKPEYLMRIAQGLAELRGVSPAEIARATTENALNVLPELKKRLIPAIILP